MLRNRNRVQAWSTKQRKQASKERRRSKFGNKKQRRWNEKMLTTSTRVEAVESISASPVSASISQKELVTRLRAFAQDPKHQSAIVNNNDCLSTICEVLSTAIDTETCVIALQTLTFLAANPKNRSILLKVPRLMARVELLTKSKHSKISILAGNLRETLVSTVGRLPTVGELDIKLSATHSSAASAGSLSSMVQAASTRTSMTSSGATGSKSRASFVMGASSTASLRATTAFEPRSLHTVYLRITNMEGPKDREAVQKCGIGVSGVISVSANVETKSATFYCTQSADIVKPKIVSELSSNGYTSVDETFTDSVSLLTAVPAARRTVSAPSRSSSGDDLTSSSSGAAGAATGVSSSSSSGGIGGGGPRYHDSARTKAGGDTSTAITTYVADPTVKTLRERLEEDKRKREEDLAKQQAAESWISSVVSYIW